MPNVKCFTCGNSIYRKPHLLKRSKHFYCSRQCRFRISKKIEVRCATCGKGEVRFASHARASHTFCSRTCASLFGRVSIECSWIGCGRKFDAHMATHHGQTVYKIRFSQNAPYSRFPFCEYHRLLLKRYRMRANSFHRIWENPDKDFGSRIIAARGTRLVIFERAAGKCQGCGKRLEFTAPSKTWIIDHFVPIYRGGRTSLNNLQVLCKKCDDRKTGLEKSEVAKLRHFAETNGHRWLTHTEKDLLIANLEKERRELLSKIESLSAY